MIKTNAIVQFISRTIFAVYFLLVLFDFFYTPHDMVRRLILGIVGYTLILVAGVTSFDKIVSKSEKFDKRKYILSQVFILLGLLFLSYYADLVKLFSIDVSKIQNYFEMGAFSLTVTGIIFAFLKEEDKKYRPRRIALLTVVSAVLFFFLGIVSTLLEQFSQNYVWFNYVKSSGFFLASYNLLSATTLLLEYFLDKWGKKI